MRPVCVFGSFVVDLTSFSRGLPVPGQTLAGSRFKMGAGGKGSNQAVAAHRAGADVRLITRVGSDVFSRVALDFYRDEGMDASRVVVDPASETGVALILVDEDSAENEIVVIPGACGRFTMEEVAAREADIASSAILLTQLETNLDAMAAAVDIAYRAGVPVMLNPAPAHALSDELLKKIDLVTPNETEAEALTGIRVTDAEGARRAAGWFLQKGVKRAVITLGAGGVYAHDGREGRMIPARKVDAVDTTGAGDAFSGALAAALAGGMDFFPAVGFANAAAALSTTRPGTAPAMPARAEIDRFAAEAD